MVIILLKFGHRSLTLKPTPHQHLPWSGLPTQPLREKGENPTDRPTAHTTFFVCWERWER